MTPQASLFGDHSSSAELSSCGRYRYSLVRRWGRGAPLVVVMLNPSTADASQDDPTIRRCVGFARGFGYGGIEVVNLYAWRATEPRALFAAAARGDDIIGERNDTAIAAAALSSGPVVVAWGAVPRPVARGRAAEVLAMLTRERDVYCLGRATTGPRHPLFVRADAELELFQRKLAPTGGAA